MTGGWVRVSNNLYLLLRLFLRLLILLLTFYIAETSRNERGSRRMDGGTSISPIVVDETSSVRMVHTAVKVSQLGKGGVSTIEMVLEYLSKAAKSDLRATLGPRAVRLEESSQSHNKSLVHQGRSAQVYE